METINDLKAYIYSNDLRFPKGFNTTIFAYGMTSVKNYTKGWKILYNDRRIKLK